jgi:hypothetical protein
MAHQHDRGVETVLDESNIGRATWETQIRELDLDIMFEVFVNHVSNLCGQIQEAERFGLWRCHIDSE